nr:hypothetical protein [Tanacetum cinerariifolium]
MIFDGMVKNVNNKISKFLMQPRFLTICLRMSQFGQITHTHQYVVPFHTKKLFTTLRVNSPSFSSRIVPFFDTTLVHQGEGSGTPTEPHHTPFPEADTSHPTTSSIPLPSLPTAPIPPVTQTDTTPIRQYSKRARIAQSSALPTVADEHASPVRDVSEGEACLTESSFIADHDRATIAKSSTLPHDSAPKVTSPTVDEGSMQQTIFELMALCTSLQRQHSELLAKFQAQEVEILRLKERVQVLEDKESVTAKQSGDDAPIKGRSINDRDAAAERISDDSEELARVLTSKDAATILAGGIDVPTGNGSIPTAGAPAADISTGSEVVPTASPIITSYSRRKGIEVMVESDTLKKQRLQEQIDAQVARELEEQQEKEDMRMNEQIARDVEMARILSQQRRPMAKKQKRDYYMTMIRNNLGWKEEAERLKRKGFNLEQEQVKKQKSSKEAPEIKKSTEEIPEEKIKEMMQSVPVEEVYVQALQVKHPIIDWKSKSNDSFTMLVPHIMPDSLGITNHVTSTSKYWGVLRILVIGLRLILLGEYNTDFYPMVDFITASLLRYALTVKPTVFVSHIRHFWSTARIETTYEGTHILAIVDGIQRTVSKSSLRRNLKLRDEDGITSLPDMKLFENLTLMGRNLKLRDEDGIVSISDMELFENLTLIGQYSRRARISQSSALPTVADEPASPVKDVSKREACPIESGFIVDQDKATIAKSSTLPHDSAPRVTSPAADKGKEEIVRLKERVQVLEDRESVAAKQSRDDAPIKRRSINEGEAAAKRISNDSEEIARVLTSMDAATVLAGGIDVPTGSGSIPTAGSPATVISTGSEVGPTTSPIVTSYSRRKGKEVMVESDTPKKQRLQEQIDAQVARELEEQQEKEDMRMNEQIARDSEVARIHAEEELQGMIDSLDKSNKTIAKYLQEYQDFALELPLEKRIELISDLV